MHRRPARGASPASLKFLVAVTGLRLVSWLGLLAGLVLLLGTLVTPTCRNYAGTARDSGYPCKVQHSGGSTEFIWSSEFSMSLPRAEVVGVILAALGGFGIIRTRRT